MLESKLSRLRNIAGEQFGMADIAIACEMHRWFALPIAHAHGPALSRWYRNIADRQAARGLLNLPLS